MEASLSPKVQAFLWSTVGRGHVIGLSFRTVVKSNVGGHAMAGRRAEARVQSQASHCRICGGRSCTGQGFL